MKKFTLLSLLLLVALAAFAAFRSKAGTQSPMTVRGDQIEWNKQSTEVDLSENRLQLKFDAGFTETRWRVGVHVSAVSKAKITVGLLSLKSDPKSSPIQQIQRVINWPEPGIIKQPGLIEYQGAPATNDIAVHVTLPAGTRLEVHAGSTVLFTSNVSRDVLIDKNGVNQRSMANVAELMIISMIGPSGPSPDVVTTASGAKVISLANLKSHLTASRRPSYPTGVQTNNVEQVVIKATIDRSGQVIAPSVMRGSPPFTDSCITALNAWRFNPFVIQGAASDVVGVFVFSFDPNGTVFVPAMGDGAI